MNAIVKINYSHDAMIDLIIANPAISQGQIALKFGYTQGWVSRVMSSDAFRARLQERKAEIVDPMIAATLEEKFDAMIHQSMECIVQALNNNPNDTDLAMKTLEIASKARGFGARDRGGPTVQANFVVQMPAPVESVEAWSKQHTPAPVVIENGEAK